jgi:hypothetical protein
MKNNLLRFLRIFYLLFFIIYGKQHVEAQGFLKPPLPDAGTYVEKDWFNVSSLGSQMPFSESNVVVFANSITLEKCAFIRYGGQPLNYVIIADTIHLGSQNYITIASGFGMGNPTFVFNLGQVFPQGSSITLICRTFVIDRYARMFFTGTSDFSAPPYLAANPHPELSFNGCYGAQFYIAAEKVVVEPNLMEEIQSAYLTMVKRFNQSILGKNLLNDNDQVSQFTQQLINLNFFYNKKLNATNRTYTNSFINSISADQSININDHIDSCELDLEQLQFIDLKDFDKIRACTGYSDPRFFRVSNGISSKPFMDISPLHFAFQNNFNYINLYTGFNDWPVIVVNSIYYEPNIRNQPIQWRGYPASNESIGALVGNNALNTLNADHSKLFSKWLLEWVKYELQIAIRANALGNKAELFNALKKIADMPSYQVDPAYSDEFNAVYNNALSMLSNAQKLVNTKRLILDSPASGRVIDILSEGIPTKYFMNPSEILINGIRNGDDWNYGTIDYVNSPNRIARLTIQGDLKIDPLIKTAVNSKLNTLYGSTLEQSDLPNITYEVQGIPSNGIEREKC